MPSKAITVVPVALPSSATLTVVLAVIMLSSADATGDVMRVSPSGVATKKLLFCKYGGSKSAVLSSVLSIRMNVPSFPRAAVMAWLKEMDGTSASSFSPAFTNTGKDSMPPAESIATNSAALSRHTP